MPRRDIRSRAARIASCARGDIGDSGFVSCLRAGAGGAAAAVGAAVCPFAATWGRSTTGMEPTPYSSLLPSTSTIESTIDFIERLLPRLVAQIDEADHPAHPAENRNRQQPLVPLFEEDLGDVGVGREAVDEDGAARIQEALHDRIFGVDDRPRLGSEAV